MTALNVGEKSLVSVSVIEELVFKKPVVPKKKILDEDTYTEKVEKIIVRDFFPDLPKLKAQSDYLDALRRNDLQKLRELHIKYGPKHGNDATPNLYSTPATFETPESRHGDSTPHGDEPRTPTHNPEPKKDKSDEKLNLDAFLVKATSEDNASFSEMMKINEEKHREKHAWLYQQEEELRQRAIKAVMLPTIEQQALTDQNQTRVETWNYASKNHVMYVPEGVPQSANQMIDEARTKPREIVHSNSRFLADPFDLTKSKKTIAQAASLQAQAKQGKIGHDGKEILSAQSPQVNGFGFMGTPSPAPGVEESPLMTWGEIEGTPFRLDGPETPARKVPGSKFKIAEVPKRDQLLHSLADEIGRAHRAKKKEALDRVKRLSTPSQGFGASRSERLAGMSPAAKRLASTKLGIRTHTDKALRASYTPSPVRKTPLGHTPGVHTPTARRNTTPQQRGSTPKAALAGPASSLTDNLLNLRKRRANATDFF